MRIPNPYFENVLGYGDLCMEQIIVEYDYPLLSVLTDNEKNRYLSMCFDTRGAQQWLIAPISNENLIALLTNRITLEAPYKSSQANIIHAVRDYETKLETFNELQPSDIPKENLPIEGEYLDAEENEWEAYIEQLREENEPWIVSYEEQPIFTLKVTKPLISLFLDQVKSKQDLGYSDIYNGSVHQTPVQAFSSRILCGIS